VSDLSLEHQIALLPEGQRELALAGLDNEDLLYDWQYTGRPSQLLPNDGWSLALALAGRGFGKTLMGAQWLRQLDESWSTLGRDTMPLRACMLARTVADYRDVMVQGPTGIKSVYPPSLQDQVVWEPSKRLVTLPHGGEILCFSAEKPDALRGPQFHVGWADELATFKAKTGADGLTAWDNLRIGVRLGTQPQILTTTTPKRTALVRQLVADAKADARMITRRGRTVDNKHLSKAYMDVLQGLYGGTSLGKQELDGELLDEVAGAMVSTAVLDRWRVEELPVLGRGIDWLRLVAVDPSVAKNPGDECGIVVIYAPMTAPILGRHAYIVDDVSLRASPATWADVVVSTAREHDATVVVEVNQGVGLVAPAIREAATRADVAPPPIRTVWSVASKKVRAEPVGAAAERGRVHIVGSLPELEDQMTGWVEGESGYSPDRLDALVHGCAAAIFPDSMPNGLPGASSIHRPTTRLDQRRQASMPAPQREFSRQLARRGRIGRTAV
jgi:phage terminase large subunit-like protein